MRSRSSKPLPLAIAAKTAPAQISERKKAKGTTQPYKGFDQRRPGVVDWCVRHVRNITDRVGSGQMQRHRIGSKEAMAEFMKNGRTSPIRPITRRSTSDKLRLRYKALRLWLGPFFPITLVVIPDECQSMPMTAPNDWNQKG